VTTSLLPKEIVVNDFTSVIRGRQLKRMLIMTKTIIIISLKGCISYLSFLLKKEIKFNIKREIIKIGDICFTEKPNRLKITKNNIKKNIENQGLSQKAYDFKFLGINNKVNPYPRKKRIKIVKNE